MTKRPYGLLTTALHGAGNTGAAGETTEAATAPAAAAHVAPIYQSAAFTFSGMESGQAAFQGSGDYIYTRLGNPTVRELEVRIAALEALPAQGAEGGGGAPAKGGRGAAGDRAAGPVDCCAFASGMAAISAVALGTGASGRRIVAQEGIYGTSEHVLRGLGRFGIRVDFVPAGDLSALRAAAGGDPPPALVYIETPANPLLQLTDVRSAAEAAHAAGALLCVDATFATPALLRPLWWGADLVVHSTTKFISGHGAALGGAVSGRVSLIDGTIRSVREELGGAADPFAAWLTLFGLCTLPLRMERHCANAEALVGFLRAREEVAAVHYPDPSALPAGQLARGGAMVSFELTGGEAAAAQLLDRLRLVTVAATLGTLDTLIQHPHSMSHSVLPEERRRALGIEPGLVRVSVGLEDAEDLLEDFRQALEG